LDSEKTASIYRICKIQHLLRRKTQQLSGGEKQRVATARLLMTSPSLLLLDEPFSNLNVAYKHLMKMVINDICSELNISIVMVSHDPADILPWADHILVLKAGEMVHSGSPRLLYNHPPNAYTAGLLGRYNTINQSIQRVIGLQSEEEEILIRPSALDIQVNEEFVNGYITSVSYYGGYEEIEVDVSGTKIWVMSGIMNTWKVGDFVQVSVRQSFFEA
jgi:iron(III) transport system ATP-binding protein